MMMDKDGFLALVHGPPWPSGWIIGWIFGLPPVRAATRVRAPRDSTSTAMSKHNSLKSSATVGGKRSVLKRFERVKLLKERGEWKDGRSPIGLPKTKHES